MAKLNSVQYWTIIKAAEWHVMFPAVLNALSEGLLKAGIHRYFLASFPSEEIYLLWFPPLKWIDITVHQVSSDSSSAPLHRQWQLSPFLWLLAFSSIFQKTFFTFWLPLVLLSPLASPSVAVPWAAAVEGPGVGLSSLFPLWLVQWWFLMLWL